MLHQHLNRKYQALASLLILSILAVVAWQFIHWTPAVPSGLYTYLNALSPDMISKAQLDGKKLGNDGWATLLAIRSTVPEQEQPLLEQIYKTRGFQPLKWEGLSLRQIELVKYRRLLLLKYPYFEPDRFVFPVQGIYWYQDSFGASREGGKRLHEGTDLFGKEGTPLVSVCAGTVEQLGWNRLGGERVGIRGSDGNYYYYAHLQTLAPALYKGKRVQKGEYIGTMGHTGDALTTPDHLHFGIEGVDGRWVNPYPFLKVWERR